MSFTSKKPTASSLSHRQQNLAACSAIGEILKTSLGPRGSDKMVSDEIGDRLVTNDGATLLKHLRVQHPAARVLVQLAASQDEKVGDGTTTAVLLAVELLRAADRLLRAGHHPSAIIQGFADAGQFCTKLLSSSSASTSSHLIITPPASSIPLEWMKKAACTSLQSKAVGSDKTRLHLANIAALSCAHQQHTSITCIPGKTLSDSELMLNAAVLDISGNTGHNITPQTLKHVKISILTASSMPYRSSAKGKQHFEFESMNAQDRQSFIEQDQKQHMKTAEDILAREMDILICCNGVNVNSTTVTEIMERKPNLIMLNSISELEMVSLTHLLHDISPLMLQHGSESAEKAKEVVQIDQFEIRPIGDKLICLIRNSDSDCCAIVLRGPSESILAESERALHDAQCAAACLLKDNRLVAGGGCTEAALSVRLRHHALHSVQGRKQAPMMAFSDALLIIPRLLASNSGLQAEPLVSYLTHQHEQARSCETPCHLGIDANLSFTTPAAPPAAAAASHHHHHHPRGIADLSVLNIVEPVSVKISVLDFASETACLIARIDQNFVSSAGGAFCSVSS